MNIRKKILFNPSHLKSNKPDSRDNTTANTKNSAILQQSKTLRFSNNKVITTRRQRNYLRTISKDQRENQSHNVSSNAIRRRNFLPTGSTFSNQNFTQIKKSLQSRNFLAQQDQLPPLINLKRTEVLTSLKERKPMAHPSSMHISSNKQLLSSKQNAKKQSEQVGLNVMGMNYEQMQKRKLKLNSVNMASFYTTQKSIALSKYSIRTKQASKQNSNKKLQQKTLHKQQQNDQLVLEKDKTGNEVDMQYEESKSEQVKSQVEQAEQQIAQQIELKNQSIRQSNMKGKNKLSKNDFSNEWSETLKSSFREGKNGDFKIQSAKTQNQSSLCESEVVQSKQIIQRKKQRQSPQNIQKSKEIIQKNEEKDKKHIQLDESSVVHHDGPFGSNFKQKQDNWEQSQLDESFQIQTPIKQQKY